MTTDISRLLDFVSTIVWKGRSGLDAAQGLIGNVATAYDHDIGAGESWVRLLNDKQVIGFVHFVHPFIIVDSRLEIGARPDQLTAILSTSLTEKVLVASPESLDRFSPGSSGSVVFPGPFSVEDLWYATV